MKTVTGTFPVCDACGHPMLTAGMRTAACMYCRALIAEAKLASLSVFGEDEWMQRVALSTLDAGDGRRLRALGFYTDITGLGGQGQFTARSQPQIIMKPEMLTVAPECAVYGMLIDFKVGNRAQMVDLTPLPLSLFSPKSWTSIDVMREAMGRLAMDTIAIAQDVTLRIDLTLPLDPLVQEAHAALGMPLPTHFKAALWGVSADDVDPMPILPGAAAMHQQYGVGGIRPAPFDVLRQRADIELMRAQGDARTRATIEHLAKGGRKALDPRRR